ncbi:MAG: hypothetical protein N3B10_15175 [Armatimonadetes bacterium]|nr:hypothetical protein [Armatimonadota bacterium]
MKDDWFIGKPLLRQQLERVGEFIALIANSVAKEIRKGAGEC